MKLYYTKGACSLAVRIIINEIGVPCEYESVDLRAKRTETDKDYYAINPKGGVPALQSDHGEILTENAIILQCLADTTHATQLLPELGRAQRYHVLEWVNYIATEMHKGFSPLFNPNIPPEIKDRVFMPLLKSKLTYINKHLQNKAYLLGEQFTLPDGYLFVMLLWAQKFKIDLAEWPEIFRYFTTLSTRKSIQQSLQQEELI